MAKNPAAVALGKLGGTARAAALPAAKRAEIARQGAQAKKSHRGWPKGTPRGPRKPTTA